MTDNLDIALRLSDYARMYEDQDIEYKPKAYWRASEEVRGLDQSVEEMAIQGAAQEIAQIDAVGEAIAHQIARYLIEN